MINLLVKICMLFISKNIVSYLLNQPFFISLSNILFLEFTITISR